MTKPSSVATAVKLMWLGAVLSLVSVLLLPTQRDAIRTEIENDDVLSTADIDAAVSIALTVAVVVGLIGTGLWIWMAVMNDKGRNWARITATVFGGLGLAFGLLGLVGGAFGAQPTMLNLVITVLNLVVALATIILLWDRRSSEWFEAPRR